MVECVQKVRLGVLNVYSPKWRADWRVSVNLEIPGTFRLTSFTTLDAYVLGAETIPSGQPDSIRRKDRLSYTHETTRIDLTQVNMQSSPGSAVSGSLRRSLFSPRLRLVLATLTT